MRHAREDYDRIQDPAGKIPAEEPVFLIRGQDVTGPMAVRAWAQMQRDVGGDPALVQLAEEHARQMDGWQAVHGSKVADAAAPSRTPLKEELARLRTEIESREERIREIYAASLAAPDDEKVADDVDSEALATEPLFKRIRYPLEISGIAWAPGETTIRVKPELVRVRLASTEDRRTHLGVLVAYLPLSTHAAYNTKSGALELGFSQHNPAIVVPALSRVVYGCESWWARIKTADDLLEITDDNINNSPAMILLRELHKERGND